MQWKMIIITVCCVWMVAGCARQETISLQTETVTQEEITQNADDSPADKEQIYVYVCGHVNQPGVYALDNGARICDALEKAGGTLEDARAEALDQAVCVADGQTIYVPGMEDTQEDTQSGKESDGLVNINQAGEEELMTLPGIGQSKAAVIIQYREEHGGFQSTEELMNIPGIKQGVFDKIKNSIKV